MKFIDARIECMNKNLAEQSSSIWHISADDIRTNDNVASRKDKYKHETLLYGNQQGNSQKKRRSYDTKDNPTKKVKNEDNGDDSGGDGNGTPIPKTKREKLTDIVVKKENPTSTDLVVRTYLYYDSCQRDGSRRGQNKMERKKFELPLPFLCRLLTQGSIYPQQQTTIEKKQKAYNFAVDKVMV